MFQGWVFLAPPRLEIHRKQHEGAAPHGGRSAEPLWLEKPMENHVPNMCQRVAPVAPSWVACRGRVVGPSYGCRGAVAEDVGGLSGDCRGAVGDLSGLCRGGAGVGSSRLCLGRKTSRQVQPCRSGMSPKLKGTRQQTTTKGFISNSKTK